MPSMPIIFYFLGVVHNGIQIDNVFLKVPSRAIPGSLKASMSLTGLTIHLFRNQLRVCYDKTLSNPGCVHLPDFLAFDSFFVHSMG